MKSSKPTLLPSEVLERLASEETAKVPLWDYRRTMEILREKDFSYQDIANWLNERLGTQLTRNQVAYVLNAHPAVQEAEQKEKETEDLMDEAEEAKSHK